MSHQQFYETVQRQESLLDKRLAKLAYDAGFVFFEGGEEIDWSRDYTEQLIKFAELVHGKGLK